MGGFLLGQRCGSTATFRRQSEGPLTSPTASIGESPSPAAPGASSSNPSIACASLVRFDIFSGRCFPRNPRGLLFSVSDRRLQPVDDGRTRARSSPNGPHSLSRWLCDPGYLDFQTIPVEPT